MSRSYASDPLRDPIDLGDERSGLLARLLPERRTDLLMVFIAAAASAAILVNALALQGGRPPVTGTVSATMAPPVAAPVEMAPTPAEPEPAIAEPPAAAKPAVKPRASAVPVPAPRPAAQPSIASLATDATGSLRPPADVEASPRLLAVQKALAKLGYGPLRIDGQNGAATRDAIIRFERDRRLPISGAVSDRLVSELNAVSGMKIQ